MGAKILNNLNSIDIETLFDNNKSNTIQRV